MDSVMQGLAENCKIDTVFRDGRVFNVAEPILEILESMLLRQLPAALDPFWRIMDSDHLARFFASNCESVPSPAPRSATVSGGRRVISVCASAFHDRPGTYLRPNLPASSSKYLRAL